jgi:signal transduction histidine kinase
MGERDVRFILLVEDNADDRARVQRMLAGQRRRYEVTTAGTQAEALELLRRPESAFDCMLVDFHLPDGDALSVLAAIRSPSGLPLPVSVLTGEDDDLGAARAIEAGAEDFLLKDSLTAHGLTRSIENVIDKHEIRHQLESQHLAVELRNQRLELIRVELEARVAEVAAATSARDRFMAMMSHEMRTPLNAILGYAELLELELDGPLSEGQARHLDRIRIGSRHLLALINDVLDLARADADKLDLDIRAVDVSAVFEEVQALLENQARQKKLRLSMSAPESGALVLADLQRLRQIVMNLVGNALKFTDVGEVTLSVRENFDPHTIAISVTDTGIGMPPSELPLVFKEFYQSENELTRPYGGSGLGLAISRRFASAMGGDIQVTSELGRGSVFTLTLPAAQANSTRRGDDVSRHDTRMASHATFNADAGGRPVVAVAAFGRDPQALTMLEEHVRPQVRLVWTTVESELVDLAEREHVSLVILDIGEPSGAAWRVAHAMSQLQSDDAPAILLLPSLVASTEGRTPSAIDLGWVSLVPKPFTAVQLTRAVTTAAGRADYESADVPLDVLVIDDDEDSRRVAGSFLADRSIHVRDCVDGESGLTEMRRRIPDVVVLDLMMPVLDGFGVLATMRADPLLAAVPVVVLTAKSLTEAERRFLERTAVRVLQKGEHRLSDVAALVLRAATQARVARSVP